MQLLAGWRDNDALGNGVLVSCRHTTPLMGVSVFSHFSIHIFVSNCAVRCGWHDRYTLTTSDFY